MKILIGCEYSGIVRDAFRAKGHDAWSCDILETEADGQHHIKGDLLEVINQGWDMMIAHPPCTYLTYAATSYWNRPGRARKRLEALDFFLRVWEAPIEKICLENPVGVVDSVIEKHTQIIHPYYFGDSEMKRTCLWLKNLPPLEHKKEDDLFGKKTHVEKPEPNYIDKSGKKRYLVDSISGTSKDAGKKRSKFFKGVAKAMADQWG
jgi:hypothetical protein